MLSLLWAKIRSLVRELRSRKPHGAAKKKKEKEKEMFIGIGKQVEGRTLLTEKRETNEMSPLTA